MRDADPHLHPRCHHNDDWTETTNHNNETINKTIDQNLWILGGISAPSTTFEGNMRMFSWANLL